MDPFAEELVDISALSILLPSNMSIRSCTVTPCGPQYVGKCHITSHSGWYDFIFRFVGTQESAVVDKVSGRTTLHTHNGNCIYLQGIPRGDHGNEGDEEEDPVVWLFLSTIGNWQSQCGREPEADEFPFYWEAVHPSLMVYQFDLVTLYPIVRQMYEHVMSMYGNRYLIK